MVTRGSSPGGNEQTPLLKHNEEAVGNNGAVREETEITGQDERESDISLAEEPSTLKLSIVLGSIWIGVFLNALDSTIVATLSPAISSEFHSFTLLSWLAAAYLIANAGFQPLSGRLTDIYGRRAGLMFANIFFLAGNIICGCAKTESVIILGRVVAGIGGGCLNTIATFVASDLVPLRRRGLWQGIGNICYGLGSGLGGVYGGWIADTIGWRFAFFSQVPFILISGCVVFFTVKIPVKETSTSRLKRVDFLGSITLVTTLVLLLLGLNSGGNIVPWNSPLIYASMILAGIALCVFILVEEKVASEPVIPVRLLLERTVAAGCLTNWFATMAFFAFLYYAPIYFQVRGLSPTAAGARLIPASLGTSIGSLSSGILIKSSGRYYLLNVVLEGIFVLSAALMVGFLNISTPVWSPFVIFLLGGLGYGGMLTITLLALISAVDHKHQAVITSASYAFRSTGSTIGISIASAVFQNTLSANLQEKFKGKEHAAQIIERIRNSLDEIKLLPPDLQNSALESYMAALQGVWVSILVMAVLAALVSLLMRENVLHKNLERRLSQ